jgi:hypothetical protein
MFREEVFRDERIDFRDKRVDIRYEILERRDEGIGSRCLCAVGLTFLGQADSRGRCNPGTDVSKFKRPRRSFQFVENVRPTPTLTSESRSVCPWDKRI